ncbi:hypothetical protein E0W68_01465 [Flavobacterium salilacus subsp. salilacus]|uniref:hypothetical protein n=1 Tax=Flavobacterium TaxID=237 RepID=UPI0013C2A8A9|nr:MULTISPECIES: hypothetical protein [Flavobacterium]KAF2519922.1 hypothetical protein E0W68_01465 [Flavobacterium salilacus subsp. salilacus]MBE1614167.1 hypothetical protein [Flavobacterium sp. SaA2.13]
MEKLPKEPEHELYTKIKSFFALVTGHTAIASMWCKWCGDRLLYVRKMLSFLMS